MSKIENVVDTILMLVLVVLCVWSSILSIRENCIFLVSTIVFLFALMGHLFLIIKQGKSRA